MPDTPASQFSAAASALGYLYQIRYALVLLLEARDAEAQISIEKFDDITFEDSGTPKELLQTKHRIRHTGSLSDASTDLWKTIRIWSSSVVEELIDPTSVILSLMTTAAASRDSIAALLRPGAARDPNAALRRMHEIGESSQSHTVRTSYSVFSQLSPYQQEQLVSHIRILDSSPDIAEARELLELRLRFNTRSQFLVPLCDRLEGWWFGAVIEHLKDPQRVPSISQRLVQIHINDLNDQFRLDNLPNDFPRELDMDVSDLPPDERLFVEQLKYVLLSNERINRAISDYYRAFQQRSRWVREDLLVDRDLEQYEERLIREWEELFHAMRERLAEDDDQAVAGRELYNAIINLVGPHIQIRPSFAEPFLMRGSYHILANTLKVGWHPAFKDRFAHALEVAVRSVE